MGRRELRASCTQRYSGRIAKAAADEHAGEEDLSGELRYRDTHESALSWRSSLSAC